MTGCNYISRRALIRAAVAINLLTTARGGVSYSAMPAGTAWTSATFTQIRRIVDILNRLGQPLTPEDVTQIAELADQQTEASARELAQILDKYTLMRVKLDAHGVGTSLAGGCDPQLNELGWRTFLVQVENPAKLTGPLFLTSRVAIPEGDIQASSHEPRALGNDQTRIVERSPDADYDLSRDPSQWLGFRFGLPSLWQKGLEGVPVEYQLLQLYSQTGEALSASIGACLNATTPGARAASSRFTSSFHCVGASTVALKIVDQDGKGLTAGLLITDAAGNVYPAPAHRIEPDLGYQWHVYRADGETIRLPAGRYKVVGTRGPEYSKTECELIVRPGGAPARLQLVLERWIDPSLQGWFPGEPHIHPEGQEFGAVSKLGVTPETVLRQVRGEALAVASVLIWTNGYYYQKQFLTGHVYTPTYALPFPRLQQENNVSLVPVEAAHDRDSLIRYDVEQAAFPSNRFGHPLLFKLGNHDYPNAAGVYDWPSWNLPILEWARRQGAVCGYAHVGNTMAVDSAEIPNYEIPTMDGIGANECLVDITHGLVDFVAGGENRPAADLNVWYHLLNCGFFVPMIGETDFPVGAGTRVVGTVRTYVGLAKAPEGDAGFDAWTSGIRAGRVYFGDGRSHIFDFRVNGHAVGDGVAALSKGGKVQVSARVAALLAESPVDPDSDPWSLGYQSWHIERARVGSSRHVKLQLIINGQVAEEQILRADGRAQPISMHAKLTCSSWIALRILPSVHSTPVIVEIRGRPVRVSRRSAAWCLSCIDLLWEKMSWRIRDSELEAAAAAWNHAREIYRAIADESTGE